VAETLGWTGGEKIILLSLMSAMIPIGAIFGAIMVGFIGNKWGRRSTLQIFGMVRILGCIINLIPTTYTFAIGRFIGGIYCGIGQIYVPLYINEIAPDAIRGKITLMYGMSVTTGQLVALALGLPFGFGITPYYWMFMFGFPILVALL